MWVSSVGTPHGGAHTADTKYDTGPFQAGGRGASRPRNGASAKRHPCLPVRPPAGTHGGGGKPTGSNFTSGFPSRAVRPGRLGRKGRAAAKGGGAGPGPPPGPTPDHAGPRTRTPKRPPDQGPPDAGSALADSRRRPTCPPGGRRGRARPPGHFLPRPPGPPGSRGHRGSGAAGGRRLGQPPAEETAAARTHRHHRGADPRRPPPPDRTLGVAPRRARRSGRLHRPRARRRALGPSRRGGGCSGLRSLARPVVAAGSLRRCLRTGRRRHHLCPTASSRQPADSPQPPQALPPARRPTRGQPPPPIGPTVLGAGPGVGHPCPARPTSLPAAARYERVRAPAGGRGRGGSAAEAGPLPRPA